MAFPADWMPCPDVRAFASRRKARKWARKHLGEEPPDFGDKPAVTVSHMGDRGLTCIVVVEAEAERGQLMALLAHECVHVAQAWAEAMGETDPGDEWEAYAVQSAMLACLKQLGESWAI